MINNGADQLTPKGIIYTSIEIEPCYFVDAYNIHTDADVDEKSLEARRSNMNQLAALINERSVGHAVIVIGDTNSRYTRAEDNFETAVLEACGLRDPWVDLKCGGVAPADADGNQLSDHYPITATFSYTLNETIQTSDTYGGGGGDAQTYEFEEGEYITSRICNCRIPGSRSR